MIGGLRLSSCCTNPVPDAEVPACPFTTLTASFVERSNLSCGGLTFVATTYASNFPHCTYASTPRALSWGAYEVTGDGGVVNATNPGTGLSPEQINIQAQCTVTAVWNLSSQTIVGGGGGPILRPGTNTVIARCSWRARRLTFTQGSRTRIKTNGISESGDAIPKCVAYALGNYCCQPCFDEDTFVPSLVAGPLQTTTPDVVATHTVQYAPICNQRVVGISLLRTGASPSTDPWTIVVAGGKIRLIDVNGNVTEYSGLINTVRNSINAAGLFTANIGNIVTATASTSDLIPVTLAPGYGSCTKELLIADVGWPVAPGTSNLPGQDNGQAYISSSVGSGSTVYFDSSQSGFPNNIEGLNQFLSATRYPKLSPTGSSFVGQFEFQSTYAGAFPLGIYPSLWSLTSGASVRDSTYTGTAFAKIDTTTTITCGPVCWENNGQNLPANGNCGSAGEEGWDCYGPNEGSFVPAPPFPPPGGPGVGYFTNDDCPSDGISLAFIKCDGSKGAEICKECPNNPLLTAFGCASTVTTYTPMPDLQFIHRRTLTGTMNLT